MLLCGRDKAAVPLVHPLESCPGFGEAAFPPPCHSYRSDALRWPLDCGQHKWGTLCGFSLCSANALQIHGVSVVKHCLSLLGACAVSREVEWVNTGCLMGTAGLVSPLVGGSCVCKVPFLSLSAMREEGCARSATSCAVPAL